jgi:signal transduction histidine kinase
VSMSERARALGGELRVVSAPADGTAVEVLLPQAAVE